MNSPSFLSPGKTIFSSFQTLPNQEPFSGRFTAVPEHASFSKTLCLNPSSEACRLNLSNPPPQAATQRLNPTFEALMYPRRLNHGYSSESNRDSSSSAQGDPSLNFLFLSVLFEIVTSPGCFWVIWFIWFLVISMKVGLGFHGRLSSGLVVREALLCLCHCHYVVFVNQLGVVVYTTVVDYDGWMAIKSAVAVRLSIVWCVDRGRDSNDL
ncbi:unnamed protein product [Linum trigynum]|uniref:Uncharacterized protein n=1 Tax=Linum trigynum TaxID=586398 RepID=A0AAV2F0T7_9ROSI